MIDNNLNNTDDELSLLEVFDFFKENYRKILLSGFIGGVLGGAYAFIVPPKYQATANIQVAKVANSDVEAPNILLEKLQMPMYYSQNSFVSCKVEDSIEPGNVIAKSIKPALAKNAPIISISYKARNVEDAKKCLESVLNDIRISQNEIAKPILEQRKNQLATLKSKLESAEQITKILSSKKPNFDFSDSKFSASTLLLATTLSKENEVKDLRTQISDLEIALTEPQTKEAYLTTPIYAPNIKVEPKRSLITLGAVFGGLVLMVGYLLFRKSWIKLKEANK
jgi:LPS O-antigen subunit length determinant protein (WzzB/FepE family)